MAWDHRYRRLNEGEIIRATDDCLADSHLGWRQDDGRCAGKPAPSPLYTSHRIYRRRRKCPICGLIWYSLRVIHAKIIMTKTRIKSRIT